MVSHISTSLINCFHHISFLKLLRYIYTNAHQSHTSLHIFDQVSGQALSDYGIISIRYVWCESVTVLRERFDSQTIRPATDNCGEFKNSVYKRWCRGRRRLCARLRQKLDVSKALVTKTVRNSMGDEVTRDYALALRKKIEVNTIANTWVQT